jgi:hypothetical protein
MPRRDARSHQQGCRNSFAGNITDCQSQMSMFLEVPGENLPVDRQQDVANLQASILGFPLKVGKRLPILSEGERIPRVSQAMDPFLAQCHGASYVTAHADTCP